MYYGMIISQNLTQRERDSQNDVNMTSYWPIIKWIIYVIFLSRFSQYIILTFSLSLGEK